MPAGAPCCRVLGRRCVEWRRPKRPSVSSLPPRRVGSIHPNLPEAAQAIGQEPIQLRRVLNAMAGRERGRNLAVQVDEGKARFAHRPEVMPIPYRGNRSGDEAAKPINDYVVTDISAECDVPRPGR